MGAYLLFKGPIGFLGFDVVTSESITMSSASTDSPVEEGVNVTDHVRRELTKVSLEVFVSNSPIQGGNHVNPRAKRGDFDGITLNVPKYKQPLNSIGALISAAIASFLPPPPPVRALLLQFSEEFDAVQETWQALDQLRSSVTLIDVMAPHWIAESMIIESLSMPRTNAEGDGAKITIGFKQLRIVETKQTSAPVPAEPRGKGIAKAGSVGGKSADPTKVKSAFKALADLFGG